MVHVGLSELKSLHSSLGSQLMLQKFEKYILILIASIIFSQIPFKVVKDSVPCDEKHDREASTWKDSLRLYIPQWVNDIYGKYPNDHNSIHNDRDIKLQFDVYYNMTEEITRGIFKGQTSAIPKKTIFYTMVLEGGGYPQRNELCKEIVANAWQSSGADNADMTPATIGLCMNLVSDIPKQEGKSWKGKQQKNKGHKSETLDDGPNKNGLEFNRSKCEDIYDEKKMSCRGDRAFFIVTSFSLTVFILIGLLMGHDLWIDLSEKEIDILKEFLPKKSKFKICDHCATKFLRGKFEDNCEHNCNELLKSVNQKVKRKEVLENPPQMKNFDRRYFWQNMTSTFLLLVALLLFTFTVKYNYQGYECQDDQSQSEHYFTCRDNNRDIKHSAMFIVWPLAVLLIISAIYKFFEGIPYESLLKALKKTCNAK